MRLISVELENFRCFEKEKIDLHPQLNVFVGLNASGKTALLEGIAISLSQFLDGLFFGYLKSIPLVDSDARRVNKSRTISLSDTNIRTVGQFQSLNWHEEWEVNLAYQEGQHRIKREMSGLASLGDQLRKSQEQDIEFPILIYFSTQRNWGKEKDNEGDQPFFRYQYSKYSSYESAFDKKTNTAFFEYEIERLQKASMQSKELNLDFDNRPLNLIRTIAAKVLDSCELFYFDYERMSLAVLTMDGRRLELNQLSDGQRTILLISTGIAFQCATLNPHMGLDAYKSSGVVLIDEVELHLHPEWQRQILPILAREFPNIQFICTTHSPQVLSTLKPEHVQVIKDFKVKPLRAFTEGRDTNAILMDVFGVEIRPKEFEDKLQHFYALLEKEDVEAARLVFDDLECHWGTMDTEIVRARYYLEDLMADLTRAKEVTK